MGGAISVVGRGQSRRQGQTARPGSRARAVGWCGVTGRGAGGAVGWGAALLAPMDGHDRPGQAMALLLCLGMTAALARGCLHCDPNFSKKFSFYRHHVNLKSWWVGDIPVSGVLLTEWSQNTMKELHLAIPAEISERRSPSQGQEKSNRDPGQGSSSASSPSRPQPGRSWIKWQVPCTRGWTSCTRGRCTSQVKKGN